MAFGKSETLVSVWSMVWVCLSGTGAVFSGGTGGMCVLHWQCRRPQWGGETGALCSKELHHWDSWGRKCPWWARNWTSGTWGSRDVRLQCGGFVWASFRNLLSYFGPYFYAHLFTINLICVLFDNSFSFYFLFSSFVFMFLQISQGPLFISGALSL